MKGSLYEGGIRVPFIFAAYNIGAENPFETGVAEDALVHVVDVFPTLAKLVGVETPELLSNLRRPGQPPNPLAIDGVPFLGVLRDPLNTGAREHMYAEEFSPGGADATLEDVVAVRSLDYKLIFDRLADAPVEFVQYHADGSVVSLADPNLPPVDPTYLAIYDDLKEEYESILKGLLYDSDEW